MMVPRSYLFQAEEKQRKRSMGALNPIPHRPRSTPLPEVAPPKQTTGVTVEEAKPCVLERTASEPVSIPMLVQPRYHPTARSPGQRNQTVRTRGQHGGRNSRRTGDKHDPNALPPAVAALLAVTAIPPPKNLQRRRSSQQQRRISIDELIQEWRQEGSSPASSEGFRSPLDVLLEPCDEENDDDSSFTEIDEEKESTLLSSRSVSSDSISSTVPSLDASHGTMTDSGTPSTPSYRSRRHLSVRTEKLVSSPPSEECLNDHPLRSPSPAESEVTIITQTFTPRPKRPVKQKSTFKSNLTASLSALKSAAKSFSNFTAPSIPQDDLLVRSFFSSPYPSEMRPKNIDGVPDPALRRYLNPTHSVPVSLSSEDFSLQLQEALAQPTHNGDDEAPLIQMQTYTRRNKRSRSRSSSVVGEAAVRQREPRENGDFLRVIVCELNMRRAGKLDAKAVLRARIWLPPRREEDGCAVQVTGGKEVPVRWVGITPNDL